MIRPVMYGKIDSFRNEYYFLSNFYECPITYGGITFRNTEAAFQSMKVATKDDFHNELREQFKNLSAGSAKKLGRKVLLRADWEDAKDNEMYNIVKQKFYENKDLADKLIATGDAYLEEGNNWNDRYWGVCRGKGLNKLGFILMKVRDELR